MLINFSRCRFWRLFVSRFCRAYLSARYFTRNGSEDILDHSTHNLSTKSVATCNVTSCIYVRCCNLYFCQVYEVDTRMLENNKYNYNNGNADDTDYKYCSVILIFYGLFLNGKTIKTTSVPHTK